MIGIIITGHGLFGSGMNAGLEMIGGKFDNVDYLDFQNDIDFDTLVNTLEERINAMRNCVEFIILTDLAGGSPFKAAISLALKNQNIHVVSGVNIPTLLSVVLSRTSEIKAESLIDLAINECKDSISYLSL